MVQLSTLFSALSKNIVSAGKKSRAALANELVLTSSDPINNCCDKNFSCGYSKRGKKGINNQDRFIVWEVTTNNIIITSLVYYIYLCDNNFKKIRFGLLGVWMRRRYDLLWRF